MRQRLTLMLIIAVGVTVLWLLFPFIASLVGAVILYVILVPVHRRLIRHVRPVISAALLTVTTLTLILGPGSSLLMIIFTEAPNAIRRILQSSMVDQLRTWNVGGFTPAVYVAQAGDAFLKSTPSGAIVVFGRVTHVILSLAIAHMGLYYLLLSSDEAWRRVRGLLPFSDAHAGLLRKRFFSVTQAMVLGMLLTALAQGTIVGLAFLVCGLSYPLVWGVMTGLASVLPMFGSALIWLPGVVVLLAQQRYGTAIVLALIGGILVSNIDNVIRMIVYRRVSNLHPMTTLVGAFAGLEAFGLIGILLGPLAISLFFEIIDIYHQEYDVAKSRM
jgi:predicted PurR-regulated permease PerM